MILIADSGSTKCDWMIVSDQSRTIAKTMGFNPFFHSEELVTSKLAENEVLMNHANAIDSIFYYGAGCSSESRNEILRKALASKFPNASVIMVAQDLDGAAYATIGHGSGIACIIGTGSNSCYFDGTVVHDKIPALGYVMGDEGSGSYFGKILLSNFLYERLPSELAKELQQTYDLTREGILSAVYNQPNANVYLASFMRFVSSHKTHPYFHKMIYDGLYHFASIHIACYDNYKETEVHFVGSIAHYFRDELDQVASELGFTIGNIVKKPIDALADYHIKLQENITQ